MTKRPEGESTVKVLQAMVKLSLFLNRKNPVLIYYSRLGTPKELEKYGQSWAKQGADQTFGHVAPKMLGKLADSQLKSKMAS